MEDESLAAWRFTIERVLIPLLVFVGVLGNMLNVAVLSRPCIKSTTNLYLTTLSFVEIFVLLFTYLLSKQYHPHINRERHMGYWKMFGLNQWFYHAVLFMSIYLTVSVVMDHCAAESYAKQKSRSNLRRAKNTISMVVFICFIFTITAAFEYQLIVDDNFVDKINGTACEKGDLMAREENGGVSGMEKMPSKEQLDYTELGRLDHNYMFSNHPQKPEKNAHLEKVDYAEFGVDYSFDTFNEMKMLSTEIPNPSNPVDDDTISTISTISNQPSALRSARATQDNFAANAFDESVNSKINSTFDAAGEDVDGMAGSAGLAGLPIKGSGANITSRCHNESFFYPTPSNFVKSEVYQAIFQPITTILGVFLPLILLITFNCKMVTAVYKSNRSSSMPLMKEPPPKKHDMMTELQQFRITVLLVALVVIFLICHTPSVFYLLYKSWQQEHQKAENSILAFEHFKNFMVTFNAACKLFVYLIFDREYFNVLRGFFGNCSSAEKTIEETNDSPEEAYISPSKSLNIDMLLLHSLSQRRYSSEIPRESRHYRIHSFSSMLPNASVTPRLSLTPSELVVIEIGRRNSHHSMHLHFNTSRRPSAAIPIKKIKSELSLTRSQSMMLKPLVKHSPDCKDNCF